MIAIMVTEFNGVEIYKNLNTWQNHFGKQFGSFLKKIKHILICDLAIPISIKWWMYKQIVDY